MIKRKPCKLCKSVTVWLLLCCDSVTVWVCTNCVKTQTEEAIKDVQDDAS